MEMTPNGAKSKWRNGEMEFNWWIKFKRVHAQRYIM